jgi:hypothetical protein
MQQPVLASERGTVFQMAEVAVPRELFRAILEGIGWLRLAVASSGLRPTMAKTHHNNGGSVFTSGRKRASEPKMATNHPHHHGKTDANRAKRLANPGN